MEESVIGSAAFKPAQIVEDASIIRIREDIIRKLRLRLQDLISCILIDKKLPKEICELVCEEVEKTFFFGLRDDKELWDLLDVFSRQHRGELVHKCFTQVALKKSLLKEIDTATESFQEQYQFSTISVAALETTNTENDVSVSPPGLDSPNPLSGQPPEDDLSDSQIENFRRKIEKSGIILSDHHFTVEHSSEKSRRGRAWIRALLIAGGLLNAFKLLSSFEQTSLWYFPGAFLTLPETSEHQDLLLSLLESLQHVDWRNLDLKTRSSVCVPSPVAKLETSDNVVKMNPNDSRKKMPKVKVRNVIIS